MEKDKVPQDEGISAGISREVQYAVDENGKYVKALSRGWEPKNIVNAIAWDMIEEATEKARQEVLNGKASPILYYMEKNMMNIALLAEFVELPKRKVKKHIKPKVFRKLKDEVLKKYADTFEITIETLKNENL